MVKFKIEVFGSGDGAKVDKIRVRAGEVGIELAKRNCVVITGGCSGLPYAAAFAAKKMNGEVWGYSHLMNFVQQKKFYSGEDQTIYSKLIFVPKEKGFKNIEIARKYRNVISTFNCDAGVIISGMWGTLNEFTNLHNMGKVIGILTGTGGVADELPKLLRKIHKPRNAVIVFDKSPKKLVEKIIAELKKRN
jgi:predicted Rossmann-fold nucleotide-binding protein